MYEIYAYGNNESRYGIFNAIAAIMGANSYLQAVAIVAFRGSVTAALAYAFLPHKLIAWQWLASVLLVYSILFVPKVTVGIVDKLGTQPSAISSTICARLTRTAGKLWTERSIPVALGARDSQPIPSQVDQAYSASSAPTSKDTT